MRKVYVIVMMFILMFPSLNIFGYPGVMEIPFDYRIDDYPGENYVSFSRHTFVVLGLLDNYTRIELTIEERIERSRKLFIIEDMLDKAIESAGYKDDIVTSVMVEYDPPIFLIGIYNPDRVKVGLVKRVLDELGVSRNFTVIFYRMLTPISFDDWIRENIFSNKSIMRYIYDLAGRVFSNYSFPMKPWNSSMELRITYALDIDGGLTIFVYNPDPSMREIKEFVRGVREVIPEHVPIIFRFTDASRLKIRPDIEVISGKNDTISDYDGFDGYFDDDVGGYWGIDNYLIIGVILIALSTLIVIVRLKYRYS